MSRAITVGLQQAIFYRGAFVFEVKGANIYDDPIVIFQAGQESLSLIPVDVNEMLNRVGDEMFLLESEAVEYIRNIFTQYSTARKSVEKVAANKLILKYWRQILNQKQNGNC